MRSPETIRSDRRMPRPQRHPSPFDDGFTKFDSEPPATVLAYLIPITATEASLVGARGWRWFEDELERQIPDIWNLARSEQVLA